MPKLTPKQSRFVEEYLIDLNATQAAIRAGYSEKTARAIGAENLTKPNIVAALMVAITNRSERTEIDQDWVVERLIEVVDKALQEKEVFDRQGKSTGEFRFDSAGANRALELLGKHHGMFMNRVKLTLEGEAAGSLAKLMGVKPEDLPE